MEQEVWKDVVGYEGFYRVSSLGNVYSYYCNKLLVLMVNKDGYHYVNLYKGKKLRTFRVHRLVGLSFLPNTENKPQINHIDFNRINNRVENLEWVTEKENTTHSVDRFIDHSMHNINLINNGGLNKKKVIMCDLNYNEIKEFDSISEASIEMIGRVTPNIFAHIRDGGIKRKTAYGYKWKLKYN